jgi:hypothetical protein
MLNRRSFLKSGLATSATLPLATSLGTLASAETSAETVPAQDFHAAGLIALPARLAPVDAATQPWQQRVRCVGQTNMTEHDPAVMNVEQWADYWHTAGADMVFVSVTGILAFYPSKVPFHKHGKYLHGRDFFGDCTAAAKKRGMRVVARMSPDLNWLDALQAHPEWAMRKEDGSPQFNHEEPRLFQTCMFTSYMTDYVPAIMREINSLYDVDCFYTNGWPPLGSLPKCWCAICRNLPPSGTTAYWDAFNRRVLELCRLYRGIAQEKKADSFFFPNLGGNVHAGPNLDQIGRFSSWFQADNQGRSYEDPAIWGCSLQARVCTSVLDGKRAGNVTGAYSTGTVAWRNGSKAPDETRMWFNESLAGGVAPYDHFVGGYEAFSVDRRWQQVCTESFRWVRQHDAHFRTRRSIANIGVVMGQNTQLLYPGPKLPTRDAHSQRYMRETTNGIYSMLLEGRWAFDFVHEDRLDPQRLAKYTALLLPNIAMLSDRQCQQIRDYVRGGGSLIASFETSLYDENLHQRADFGLADLLGTSKAGAAIGSNGNAFYGRIERAHPILEGFHDTDWIPGAQNRVPLKPVPNPILTVVPGFVQYPPELAYPPVERTSEPAVVLGESGSSRTAWFPGDIERTWWLTGNTDLLRLMQNTLRWVARDQRVVSVEGPGLVEVFAWETEPGYAIHLLNYTNPNAHHGWVHAVHPIGPQQVAMTLPDGIRVRQVELLRAGTPMPFQMVGQTLRFTIPGVQDYEVAGITIV